MKIIVIALLAKVTKFDPNRYLATPLITAFSSRDFRAQLPFRFQETKIGHRSRALQRLQRCTFFSPLFLESR